MPSEVVKDEDRPSENWPDKEFLETALREWLEEPKLNVTDFRSRIATNKGDNYTSDMYRVTVKCEQRKDSLTIILKRLLSSGYSGEMIINSTLFVREVKMLSIIIPEMYGALKKVVPDVEPFGAGFIYSIPGVLALEDLNEGGFRMAPRQFGLDLKHCTLVIASLARYHAASVYLMELKSIDFSVFRKSFQGEPHGKLLMNNFCNGMLRVLSEELENFENLRKYSAKVRSLAESSFLSLLQRTLEDNEKDDFLVLSHGDLWVNNIMFRYSSSGDPEGVRFVDLQAPCITSPCIDLQYFLTTSTNEAVRTSSLDQLIEEYHKVLCNTMTALGCSTKPPTIENLRKDWDKRTYYGMFGAFNVMPVVLCEPGLFDFCDVSETGKPGGAVFRGRSYKNALEWFLPIFESKGFL